MLITNATGKKIRLSVSQDISQDQAVEAFAYIIRQGNGLDVPEEDYIISIEEEKE